MDNPKCVATQLGRSTSQPNLKCRICILEVQDGHYTGFAFGMIGADLEHFIGVGATQQESLDKCTAWVRQKISDCVFDVLKTQQ